ncbi:carbohydrate ABC transporter permease [Jiangella sp. DSM 45060]|uniref:carbohydrate ABC transporter permease n=1 Tax=Jiangella sp. DSM 45060 TaxID=1798224 RepID=UPI00087AF34E|nr:carbohydrate ABC transporter permease [Jiangella sp. DSM 45060]SDS19607.1 raffinose/stachyose/melibiose transport system permease protein [Jiangella sp. DSM 45060]
MIELRRTGARAVLQAVTTFAIVPFLAPFVVMLGVASSGEGAVANFGAVLDRPELTRFALNSAVIAVLVVVITYVCTMTAAYALAKLRIRAREPIFYFLVAALTLPTAALTVPLFITVRSLGLYNNPLSVILPLAALQISFNVLLARQFIRGIPDELLEAADLDGASAFGAFRHIILPLSRPITAVILIWSFVGAWNEYLLPLIFLQDTNQQTLTLLPSYFASQFSADQTKIFAASCLIALPTVICYIAFQRYFERGLTAGALK